MIFSQTWQKVLAGEKTQTRRLTISRQRKGRFTIEDYGVERVNGHPQAVILGCWLSGWENRGREKWRVGKTYAVCPGRGKHQVGRIRITSIRREFVRDISESDAREEGFENVHAFLEIFFQLNPSARLDSEVWALNFELVKGAENGDLGVRGPRAD